jgi:ankyrin repeat protein
MSSALRVAALLLGLLLSLPAISQGSNLGAELRSAASRGDAAVVRRLIAQKAPLDARDGQGQTALLLAVAGGHTEAGLALIDAGADINAAAANMDTPWLLAGARGRTEMLRRMWPKGPNLELRNRFGGSALIPACHYEHLETVKFLLTTRIDINLVNNLGWTCLLEIMILTNGGPVATEITRLVLEAGADPNIRDKDGVSPLQHARKRGFKEIAKLLEAKGGK